MAALGNPSTDGSAHGLPLQDGAAKLRIVSLLFGPVATREQGADSKSRMAEG
jgi:hypothetical protein